jgi:hypothetical protein
MNRGSLILKPQLMLLLISTAFPPLSSGIDVVHMGNGTSLNISHIGSTIMSTYGQPLLLTNVLHVPAITKKLLSIYQLTKDNNVLVEFTSNSCFIKERLSRKTILTDTLCKGCIYWTMLPLHPLLYYFKLLSFLLIIVILALCIVPLLLFLFSEE